MKLWLVLSLLETGWGLYFCLIPKKESPWFRRMTLITSVGVMSLMVWASTMLVRWALR